MQVRVLSLAIMNHAVKIEFAPFEALVLLKWMVDPDLKKIAEETGYSVRNVDNALSRVKTKLRSKIE